MYNYVKTLTAISSVSGREKAVSDKLATMIAPFCDRVYTDPMGNLIAKKEGYGPVSTKKKILLCAHMDEIGFLITGINEKGFLRVAPIGGIRFVAAAYTKVLFENGMRGIMVPEVGADPSKLGADNVVIDVGAKDKKEAEKRVHVGDFCVLEPGITRLCGKRIAGRPLDDRVGCAILLSVAEKLKDGGCCDDVYFVFSVQEEVGLRGAKTAAYGINPDYALVFDVTGTGDEMNAKPMECCVGGGAAIKVKDASVLCDAEMVDKLTALANEQQIRYQHEILLAGGTDTAAIQMTRGGVRVGGLSVPTRYIHSGVELLDLNDAQACAALAVAFVHGI